MQLLLDDYLAYLEWLPDLHRSANVFMTITPLLSYGSTCFGIYKRQTSVGFSIDICATMIMAATLRIYYYIMAPFEITLLRQAVIMIFIQFILLKVSLSYRPRDYDPDLLRPIPPFTIGDTTTLPTDPYFVEKDWRILLMKIITQTGHLVTSTFHQAIKFFDVYYRRPLSFWQWKGESNYWMYIAAFMTSFGVLTFIFQNNKQYANFVGILGLFIESLLPLPQILMLQRLKSVKNFKIILLLLWLGGDTTKLSYLIYGTKNISIIFLLAGLFQMGLDIVIAWQYLYFRKLEREQDEHMMRMEEEIEMVSVV